MVVKLIKYGAVAVVITAVSISALMINDSINRRDIVEHTSPPLNNFILSSDNITSTMSYLRSEGVKSVYCKMELQQVAGDSGSNTMQCSFPPLKDTIFATEEGASLNKFTPLITDLRLRHHVSASQSVKDNAWLEIIIEGTSLKNEELYPPYTYIDVNESGIPSIDFTEKALIQVFNKIDTSMRQTSAKELSSYKVKATERHGL